MNNEELAQVAGGIDGKVGLEAGPSLPFFLQEI
jgi:hypothetical protein